MSESLYSGCSVRFGDRSEVCESSLGGFEVSVKGFGDRFEDIL